MASFPNLKRLCIGYSWKETSLEPLRSHKSLETLVLDELPITKERIDFMLSLPKLREVDLEDFEAVSETDVRNLQKALPNVKILHNALRVTTQMASCWKCSIEQTIMKSDIDRRKTLTELEGKDWGPPNFDSHLVTTIHQVRHKPLEDFTVEDLRITIGQNIALQWLLPMAIERLRDDPFVEGDYLSWRFVERRTGNQASLLVGSS